MIYHKCLYEPVSSGHYYNLCNSRIKIRMYWWLNRCYLDGGNKSGVEIDWTIKGHGLTNQFE